MTSSLIDLIFEELTQLLVGHEKRILTLDQVGAVIGNRAMGADEIELLFFRLEQVGIEVSGDETIDLEVLLRTVIRTALDLRREGVKPNAHLIAERSGLSKHAVRMALLYSDVLRS